MSIQLNKSVGIACLSVLLQFGVSAQNTTPNVSSDKPIPSSDPTTKSSNEKNPTNTRDEARPEGVISEPRVGIKNPSPELKMAPNEVKLNSASFSLPEINLSDSKTFRATAYALKGRTRSGAYVRRGVIAADPRILPLGSVVQVTAGKYSGVYTVHDTGGKIKGDIIDVWMPTNKEARQFGRRKVKLQVIKLGKTRIKH